MIDTAVILAAGRGTRLEALGTQIPKGFIRLGERPIVEESIIRLRRAGISRIIIVTGHLDEHYRDLAARLGSGIERVHNPLFSESGSMHSLYAARDLLTDSDFLLLESDLTFEQRALSAVLEHAGTDVLLCSGTSASGDEVYVEADGNRLVNVSKRRADLGGAVIGELVGITRVSAPLYRGMLASAEAHFRNSLRLEYEHALVAAGCDRAVDCLLVDNLLWAEIDDAHQLERAAQYIYPHIVSREHGLAD
ncbi:MAG: phosphocholine cytidylyltransferase family protein [Candidatus Accumulibacter phosphatis]|jgi:choline kinase|uniref:Glucose-1-phosphate thymidylyltransferase n=2 Tax=Candidatus Accumulibacter TaxID=327159 RepID=A0A080LZQ5_9PROT|nr:MULTISPECIES: phosphocholine cytidylyltransferase family protein [Candidatus Accumulibacter]KFB74467.1 MAG: Glucose-1-phosphate thymidylyltransferase [Candidatus Accumulibacter phosphatis]NMQ04304.1 phosphocholine cytidylyltransferase family protein [Candidatus Accumulibacter contiguus]HRF06769.1 phosphocholine cytidylyltransferase family protein [Accumulibacter sp.]